MVSTALRHMVRRLLPRGAKDTLRLRLLLDWPEGPPQLIREFNDAPVLVFAPHMDDEVIGCGGAIIRHRAAGAPVTVAYVTDGSRGNSDLRRDVELTVLRKREAEQSSHILGGHGCRFLDLPDGELAVTEQAIGGVEQVIAQVQPTVIYLPSVLDTHADHWATTRLVSAAMQRRNGSAGGIVCRQYEVWSTLVPNRLVDISDCLDQKLEALSKFTSQLHDIDYVAVSRGLSAYRAIHHLHGRGHAEAFYESTPAELAALLARSRRCA